MSIEALFLSKIVEKIFSYSIDKGQSIIEKWILDKTGLEPRKRSFESALGKAFNRFEKKYPQWTADLFNSSFLEKEGAQVLAQFLVLDGNPDPTDLATRWAASLNINQIERHTTLVRELEPAATDFL